MNEIFKTIKGFDNYQVSNLGRIKSLNYRRTGKEQLLKQRVDKDGYLQVGLSIFGKQTTFQVHRLVAYSFIDNPDDKEQINHKNGIKCENNIDNLEWCTQSENQKHRFDVLGQTAWNKGLCNK